MAHIETTKILTEEANTIHGAGSVPANLNAPDLYRKLGELGSTALCFSGGGIRSASFCLGVIEALASHPRPNADATVASAKNSMLAQFNYLSTVSGGGYVGGWLSAWLARAHLAGSDGWSKVWASLAGKRASPDEEPTQIAWLRIYSNYLTPRLGLASGDTWAAIAICLRNLVLNWFVLLPVLGAVLLILKLLAIAIVWTSLFDPRDTWQAIVVVVLGLLSLLLALWFSNRQRPSHGRSRATQGDFFKWDLAPGWLAALLFTFAMAFPAAEVFTEDRLIGSDGISGGGIALLAAAAAALYAASWLLACPRRARSLIADFAWWTASGLVFGVLMALGIYLYFAAPTAGVWPFQPREILLLTFAVPWVIVSGLLAEMIFVGLNRDTVGSDADREWLGRAAGTYLLVALAWPIAMCLVFVGSTLADQLYHQVRDWIVAGGISAGAVTAFLGKNSGTPANGEAKTKTGLSLNVILAIAATVFAVVLVIGLSALLDHVLFGEPLTKTAMFNAFVSQGATPPWPGGILVPAALALVVLIGAVASSRVNINRFSLHALYRNRLIRGFLGASNTDRKKTRNPFTDFDENDNLRAYELWPQEKTPSKPPKVGPDNWRPFHIVNMALNIVASKNLAWQERKAESFTVSPLHSGSSRLGFRYSSTYGDGQGISLGTAVAISGAAASPNMGYHSSPPLALLLTLFNVRLGWWLGNPGPAGEKTYDKPGPPFAIKPLLCELFGQTTDDRDYVYLSDGGHFENLGLYEMVRRRCRHIVAIDAGCDKEFAYEDLGNAVRKISIDLGVSITFAKLDALMFRAKADGHYKDFEPPFYALGVIDYPGADGSGQKGTILYIKPAFHSGRIDDVGVRNYATKNPDFPHQSTGNQWFSESELESYRALGCEMMDGVLNQVVRNLKGSPNPTLPQIFATLAEMHKPAPGAGGAG